MDRLPLHRQLADLLRAGMEQGIYPVGQPLPSEPELAQRYGVSRQTVRHALGTLAAEHRISRFQGKGTFVSALRPETPARRDTVGLVAAHLAGPFLLQVLVGIERALSQTDAVLAVRSSQEVVGGEVAAVQELLAAGARGLIVEPSPFCGTDPAFFNGLVRAGTPLVLVDRCLSGVDAPCVSSDNLAGGLQLARHVLQQGHRRLAYLLPEEPPVSSVQDRMTGAKRALVEAGLPPSALIARATAQTPERHGQPSVTEVLRELLSLPLEHRPTALLCSHDDIALQALRALQDLGVAVPEGMAVAGYDDLPYAAWSQPSLTTVRQDAYAMGEQAVLHLWRGLAAPAAGPVRVLLPVGIRIRASTLGDQATSQDGSAPGPPDIANVADAAG